MSSADFNPDYYPGSGNLTSQHNGICYGNATLCIESDVLCTLQTCDLTLAHFDYIPSLGGNALYAAIFGVCIIGQLFLGIRYRTWGFMIAALFGLALEVVGYAVRVMMNSNPFDKNNFLIYLVCLTIAPAFLTASIYLCLARIVVVYGESMSRFRPRTYTILFCSFDFLSLLLQAIGGAIASTANDYATTQTGINIMIAGLAFQVFSLVTFITACLEFALRLYRDPQGWNMTHCSLSSSSLFHAFLIGLGSATLAIFIRSCFRVAELSGGFHGPLANNEPEFMVLEGGMVSVACICLTVLHPGFCFKGAWSGANFKFWKKGDSEGESEEDKVEGEEFGTRMGVTPATATKVEIPATRSSS